MKMCYRGVHYDYSPVFFNSNEQQKYFIDRGLADPQTIQIKFLGKICQKKAVNLVVKLKNTRFLGQISNSAIARQSKVNEIV